MIDESLAPALSVVIPAYNEERRLGASLRRIVEYFRSTGLGPEIILVDDGSRDGTAAVGREFLALYDGPGALLLNHRNRGKGYSVRRGVLAASGERVLITDADLSTPIEEAHALFEAQERERAHVVIGSRALPASRIEVRQPALRERLGMMFNRIMRSLTGLRYRDTQCGFKLLERSAAQSLARAMSVDGFAFDVELLWLAQQAGLRVHEQPVRWRNSRGSSVSLLSDAPRMLWDLVLLRRRLGRPAGGARPAGEGGAARAEAGPGRGDRR